MGENAEKMEIVVANPLAESGVEKMIQIIRGKQVLLDRDLATLYGVETKYINRAVKRNPKRFPGEFYFELTKEEFLRCQIGTLVGGGGKHSKYSTFAFTEQSWLAVYHDTLKNGFFDYKNGVFCKFFKYLYHSLLTFERENIY